MKKIILTLIISCVCLVATSFLISLNKNPKDTLAEFSNYQKDNNLSYDNYYSKLPLSENVFLTASLTPNYIPIRNWTIETPEFDARTVAAFDPIGKKFLYQKNINKQFPIASLTKIMTATVAIENLNLQDIITISKKAVMTESSNGDLIVGEKLTVEDLLYIMLIESSNDAAIAIADNLKNFIDLMNQKAKELNLNSTFFVDATGISEFNYSTAHDLIRLVESSFNKSLLWEILKIKETTVYSQDKKIPHQLKNTNKLLGELKEIISGKTGFTQEAGECMLTIAKVPNKSEGHLVVIILGSNNRELETKKIINWISEAYVW